MANLETLELTISANAESASQGIGQLTRSLSALSAAVGRSVGGLMRLNAELKTLKGYGKMKLPGVGDVSNAKAVAKGARGKGASDYDPATNNNRAYIPAKQTAESIKADQEWYDKFRLNAAADYARKKEYHEWATQRREEMKAEKEFEIQKQKELQNIQQKAMQNAILAEKKEMDARGEDTKAIMEQSTSVDLLRLKQDALKMETISLAKEGKLTAKQIAERSIQYQKLGEQINKLTDESKKMKEEMPKAIEAAKKSASGLLSTIGRIFKTMLIRTAIRALLKAAKEGLDNYYQYSKKVGNSFAETMDKLHNKWGQFKNQLGAAIGTGLKAILPLLNALASAALVALNTITALFALISGSDTYTVAVEGMEDYGEEIKKTGKAANDWLATFDELNVMTRNTGSGTGEAAEDIASMFKEVPLPEWMVEWKPIIEAILAGVLGATILPKIWDWVSKIFGLFGGKAAETAMDFVEDLLDGESKLPDFGSQATDMVLFGGGAATAAAALPVVSEYIEKIVAALDGVSLVGSLFGLIAELITKAVSAIPVPFKLDTEEYDEFVKKHEEWIKTKDVKTDTVVVDIDVATITRLTQWVVAEDTKVIDVVINKDAAEFTSLTLWTVREDTKTINVKVDPDIATITKLTNWIATDDTKVISVKIDKDAAALSALTLWLVQDDTKVIKVRIDNDVAGVTKITGWVATVDTKTIKVKVDPDVATITKITGWVATVDEKVIAVKLSEKEYAAFEATKDIIQLWVDTVGSKQIGIGFSPVSFAAFAIEMAAIEVWVGTMPTKYIVVKIVDNNEVLLHLTNWINTEDTKSVNIKFNYGQGSNSVEKEIEQSSSNWVDDVKRWLSMSVNEMINAAFGTNLPKGFIPAFVDYAQKHHGSTADKIEIDISQVVKTTNWADLTLNEKIKFLQYLKDTFGSSEAASAVKQYGINIGQVLQYGMQSEDENIRSVAEEWSLLIKSGVESKTPVVSPKVDNEAIDWCVNDIEWAVADGDYQVYPNVSNEQLDYVTNTIESVSATINDVTIDTNNLKNNVRVPGELYFEDGTWNAIDDLASYIKKKLGAKITVKTEDGTYITGVTVVAAQSGGLFNSGDLFVANENGTSEMVGRFGNQTGVANQQEIISGIQRGVSEANEEQNELLRQQNSLLRGILEKDSTVRLGASAALGRVARQSLDMYSGLVGG